VVNSSQPTQQSDIEMLAVPKEMASTIQEVINLYKDHSQKNIIESLKYLILNTKRGADYFPLKDQSLVSPNYPNDLEIKNSESESEGDFLKSWDNIFNVQVYIDTDIFGELDPRPPALLEIHNVDNSETVIQHTDATEVYIQTWKELAQSMSSFPDDLFTRLWTTVEISKILDCSPSSLRRARKNRSLPIRIKDLIIDCISHDGKRSLWFVRPS
jgi:hypothetical protein